MGLYVPPLAPFWLNLGGMWSNSQGEAAIPSINGCVVQVVIHNLCDYQNLKVKYRRTDTIWEYINPNWVTWSLFCLCKVILFFWG